MTSPAPPPKTHERTAALVLRIQEVEQEIARVREERSRDIENEDPARIEELEARVREAERRLEAQLALPRPVSGSPSPASVLRSARITMGVLGGVLMVSAVLGVGTAVYLAAEWTLVAVAAAPGLIAIFVLGQAFYAKKLAELDPGDA